MTSTAQQIELDNALVAPENRRIIGKCNTRINPGMKPKEPTYQVALDALALTACYPAFLITAEVPETKACKLTLVISTCDTPPPKAGEFKKPASPKLTTVPVSTEEPMEKSKRVKRPAKKLAKAPARGRLFIKKQTPEMKLSKKKEKVDVTQGKRIELLSQVALNEDAQFEEVRRRDERHSAITHPRGSIAVKSYPSITNNENKSDFEHETDENESGSESDQDENKEDEDDEEEVKDELVKTPSNDSDDEDETKFTDKAEGFVQEEGTDAAMTNVQQGNENPEILQVIEDAHVTLSTVPQKTEVPVTSSSHSSDLAAKFLNFSDIPYTDAEIVSPMDVHIHHEVPSQQTPTLLTVHMSRLSLILHQYSLPSSHNHYHPSLPTHKTKTSTPPLLTNAHMDFPISHPYKAGSNQRRIHELPFGITHCKDHRASPESTASDFARRKWLTLPPCKFNWQLLNTENAMKINEENLGNDDEEPKEKVASKRDWFTKPTQPQEPTDPDWNVDKTPQQGQNQSWLMTLASSAEKPSKTFDELMSTPIDFSAFIMNGLKINNLTQETLLGPAFRLLKGTCSNYAELEYEFEECYKALSEKLDWENPEGGIEDMVPNIWFMLKLPMINMHYGESHIERTMYGYLKEIVVRRADNDLYRFKEGDFPRLRINDIEDMLLLVVQNRLTNLSSDDVSDFAIALRMFTRSLVIQKRVEDLQLGSSSKAKIYKCVAFVSSNSTNSNSSTNEADNTAYGVSAAHTQSNPTSGDNLSDAMICAFLASKPTFLTLAMRMTSRTN
ncbi:hypothetical protein Tco_0870566 [Tanacetum coccineum]